MTKRAKPILLKLIQNEFDHEEVATEGELGDAYKPPSEKEIREKASNLIENPQILGLLEHMNSKQVGRIMRPFIEGNDQKIEIGKGLRNNYESHGFYNPEGARAFIERLKEGLEGGGKIDIRVEHKSRAEGDPEAPKKYSVIKYQILKSHSLDEYTPPEPKKKKKIVKKRPGLRPVKRAP